MFYVLLLFGTALLGGFLAAYARQRWSMRAVRPFSFLMVCVAWWGLFAALSAIVPNEELAVLLGVQFRFTGVILVAPCALFFALAYNGRMEWFEPRRVALILAVPVITLILNWTAAWHDLFVYDVAYQKVGGIWLRSAWSRGIWFSLVYNPFSYVLLISSLYLLAKEVSRTRYPYRQQAFLIFIGGMIPLVASIPAALNLLRGPNLDLIVLGFLVMGILYAGGLSRFHLLNIMPIARSTVIENVIDPMLILDNEDRVVELNPALYTRMGLSRREAVGLTLAELFADWPDLLAKYSKIREGQLVISVPANERIYHFDVRISPIVQRGRQLGRLIVWRDITQLKQTELALEANLRRMESLFLIAQSISGIVRLEKLFKVVVDRVALVLPADRVALIVFDQEAEQITHFVGGGPGVDMVRQVSYEELMLGLSGWVLQNGKPALSLKGEEDPRESTAVRQRRKETQAGSIMVAPILFRDQILGTLTAIKRLDEPDFDSRDMELLLAMANQVAVAIENTRLYEQQRAQVAELEESNEALQAFSQMVAHDLKGPVTIMMGYAELILTGKEMYSASEADLHRYAEIIHNTNRKMGRIINDLLLLAQIRQQEELPLQALKMAEVVAEVLSRLRWDIEKAGAKVRCLEGWPVVVGYGPWVEEVWVNYLSNALKYGGDSPEIVLGFDEENDAEGQVRSWVQDWGPGISAEKQASLFLEFSRVGAQRVEGHGLGLSIVRRITERMGGSVGVESEVGMGSRFWFSLERGEEK